MSLKCLYGKLRLRRSIHFQCRFTPLRQAQHTFTKRQCPRAPDGVCGPNARYRLCYIISVPSFDSLVEGAGHDLRRRMVRPIDAVDFGGMGLDFCDGQGTFLFRVMR